MIIKLFKTFYIYTWILLITLVLATATIIIATLTRRQGLAHRIAQTWARLILWGSRIRVTIIGAEHLAGQSAFILMPNHQSHFDIPVLLGCLGAEFRWLAKAELFKIPIFGRAMRGVGYISIDRSNRKSAFESLARAADTIRNGTSVLIFPEGTRSRDGSILPFKKGGFVLAVDAGVPIVPIVIHGTRDIIAKGRLMIRPRPVTMQILDPVETSGYTRKTKDALLARIRSILSDHFENEGREQ